MEFSDPVPLPWDDAPVAMLAPEHALSVRRAKATRVAASARQRDDDPNGRSTPGAPDDRSQAVVRLPRAELHVSGRAGRAPLRSRRGAGLRGRGGRLRAGDGDGSPLSDRG